MLVLLLSLGTWQLDRAKQKRDFQAAYTAAQQAAPRPVSRAADLVRLPRYEPVRMYGSYDGARQSLLDAQVHRGTAGYRVWTPFVLDSGGTVLVDRGWVPSGAERSDLPEIGVGSAQRTVSGLVAPLPSPGIRVGAVEGVDEGWPRRLLWPDAATLERLWGADIVPVIVLLSPQADDGFVREWEPATAIPPERHVGYAVQWYGLAVALVVIFLVLTLRRKETDDE
jgi:surfeit locus 1 family protein